MRGVLSTLLALLCCAAPSAAQTAEELVAKNTQAKGGIEKIKAIKTLRMSGKVQSGGFTAQIEEKSKVPAALRQNFTVEGMTAIEAYDGSTGWQISPFQGRKDP